MKLFISIPMQGKSIKKVRKEMATIYKELKEIYPGLELIDSIIDEDGSPLWYLGRAIQLMDDADIVYMAKDWIFAKGCRIEHQCAVSYGKEIISYTDGGKDG